MKSALDLLGRPLDTVYLEPGSRAAVQFEADQARARASFSIEVPNNPGTVNEARVSAFAGRLGVAPCEYAIIDGQSPESRRWLELRENDRGRYSGIHHLAIVNRKGQSDVGTEQTLVHETIGHGADLRLHLADQFNQIDPHSIRTGFLHFDSQRKVRGTFWAEGNAELHAGVYTALAGLAIDYKQAFSINYNIRDYNLLPTKYMDLHDDTINISFGGFAATTIEIIAMRNPKILDTLLRTKTDPVALLEFEHQVDSLSPGLFDYLNKLPYNTHAGDMAMNYVHSELLGSRGPQAQTIADTTDAFFKDRIGTQWADAGTRP